MLEYPFGGNMRWWSRVLTGACALALTVGAEPVQGGEGEAAAAREMARAAGRWLGALSPELRAEAVFPVENPERYNWNFVPRERLGVAFGAMDPAQRGLAEALVASGLSHLGYIKAQTIVSLEPILAELEGPGRARVRNPEDYFLTVFGEPGERATWGWRFEGHHLSLNFVVAGGVAVAGTPSFFGANPARVPRGPREGLRALPEEEDAGRALAASLDAGQWRVALVAEVAPADIVTGASRKAWELEPKGISWGELRGDQQALLRALVEVYVRRERAELAARDLEKMEAAGWAEVYFAWAGGREPGQKHYYRVQGPTFLIEYDNTQNGGNHIHSVYRDWEGDFGEDLLRRHYAESAHGKN